MFPHIIFFHIQKLNKLEMTSVDGSRSFITIILKQTLCPAGGSKCCVWPHSITLWLPLPLLRFLRALSKQDLLPPCFLITDRLCSLLLYCYHPVKKHLLNFFSLKQSIFSRSFTLANRVWVNLRQEPEMCLRRKIYPLAFPEWCSGKESTCSAGDLGSNPV